MRDLTALPAKGRMLAVFHPPAAEAQVQKVLDSAAANLRGIEGVRVMYDTVEDAE